MSNSQTLKHEQSDPATHGIEPSHAAPSGISVSGGGDEDGDGVPDGALLLDDADADGVGDAAGELAGAADTDGELGGAGADGGPDGVGETDGLKLTQVTWSASWHDTVCPTVRAALSVLRYTSRMRVQSETSQIEVPEPDELREKNKATRGFQC